MIKECYRKPAISVISVERESFLLTNGGSETNYCCPIKPLYTAISSLNPAEIGMISSYFKFQAPH